MKTNSKPTNLKDYAKLAKRRMASGYWDKVRGEIDEYIKNNQNENPERIREIYSKRLMREIYFNNAQSKDDELYRKVCRLLNQNSYVLNPISQLIDHNEYDRLDFNGRQTYIIKLTDKYNELRERYEREKEARVYNII